MLEFNIRNRGDNLNLVLMDGSRVTLRLEDEFAGPGQVGSMRLDKRGLLELIQAATTILLDLDSCPDC